MTVPVEVSGVETVLEFVYQSEDELPLWDEFSPAMLQLSLQPEGRQMLHSLLNYVGSEAFRPEARLSRESLKNLLP